MSIKRPKAARGVGSAEGVSPIPSGEGSGEGQGARGGALPLPRKFLIFHMQAAHFGASF